MRPVDQAIPGKLKVSIYLKRIFSNCITSSIVPCLFGVLNKFSNIKLQDLLSGAYLKNPVDDGVTERINNKVRAGKDDNAKLHISLCSHVQNDIIKYTLISVFLIGISKPRLVDLN